ncbi:sensor domain-containing diguanylate cyclase [Paucibacter sp. DJ2R-2]|uniref:sensor domain-containing diguanylate cyclase n=1 Tax=Paucibacter sp. DJ2R-2 TaxID=2893558 RepID=UPI0021E4036D|nr:sensor domain-containing diguanylate cyclase [Paucibacter sp. DJ2R-2]MCV2438658.1 sensor domain-containing diguanylate cyclase [Paucibacter sp. DJ2R-2]
MANDADSDRFGMMGIIADELVDAIITIRPDQTIVVANKAATQLLGYSQDELLGLDLTWLMPERFRDAHRTGMAAYLKTGGKVRKFNGYIDIIGLTKEGREIPLSLSMTCTVHGDQMFLTGVLRDMSALAAAKQTIHRQLDEFRAVNDHWQRLADQDPLTQTLNRRALQRLLPELWYSSKPPLAPMAILLCDIDHFKQYNDTYGHLDGDRCLISIAKALRDTLGDAAPLVRFGGEEFIALLPSGYPISALEAATKMQRAVWDLNIEHTGSSVKSTVTLSIGGAIHGEFDVKPESLLRHADDALYVAKRVRNYIVFWNSRLMGA